MLDFSRKVTAGTTLARVDDHSFSANADDVFADPRNPRVRRLMEYILFSRRFIWTYYIAIACILAVFTIVYWVKGIGMLHRRRRRYRAWSMGLMDGDLLENKTSASSSSSSTLRSPGTPTGKADFEERAPLLDRNQTPSSLLHDSPLQRLTARFNAFLMYQPRPIPSITSSSNSLPTNGTSLVIILFLALNFFYLLYKTPLSTSYVFVIADRAGLCFVANLPILYILAAKTNQPIKLLTGRSYEGLNIFHRRLGEWMIFLAVLHTVGMFLVWYSALRPVGLTLARFLASRIILLGIFAFTAYILIFITSTGSFRQLYYETFLGLHVVLQIAALVLLFFHHHNSRPFVLASLAIWALDRFLIRYLCSATRTHARIAIAPDNATVVLSCDITIDRSTHGKVKARIGNGWSAGQHVFVTIPFRLKHALQTHPFSIASPAPPPDLRPGELWQLDLIIRAKKGFSKELLAFAKAHSQAEVVLDGPYGSDETVEAVGDADRVCFIAGGSGIAVTYPLAWSRMVADRASAKVSSSTEATESGDPEPRLAREHVCPSSAGYRHIWVHSLSSHRSWIQSFPMLAHMNLPRGLTSSQAEQGRSVTTMESNSGSDAESDISDSCTKSDPKPVIDSSLTTQPLEVGSLFDMPLIPPTRESANATRPDVGLELREWATGARCERPPRRDQRVCVVCSGPHSMVRDVRNAASRLVKEGWNINVHVEKFGW